MYVFISNTYYLIALNYTKMSSLKCKLVKLMYMIDCTNATYQSEQDSSCRCLCFCKYHLCQVIWINIQVWSINTLLLHKQCMLTNILQCYDLQRQDMLLRFRYSLSKYLDIHDGQLSLKWAEMEKNLKQCEFLISFELSEFEVWSWNFEFNL